MRPSPKRALAEHAEARAQGEEQQRHRRERAGPGAALLVEHRLHDQRVQPHLRSQGVALPPQEQTHPAR
jgi:hypothetical protein